MQTPIDSPVLTPTDSSAGEEVTQFLAGCTVPAGTYCLVGTDREVRLDQEDVLPATCDGHVGVYEHRPPTWAERQGRGIEPDVLGATDEAGTSRFSGD